LNTWQGLALGILQGLTEFLPISSSGHLVLMRGLLGIMEAPVTFEVIVHLGTAGAVVLVLGEDLRRIWRGEGDYERHLAVFLILALLPMFLVLFISFFFSLEVLFNPFLVGFMLVLTGTVLKGTGRIKGHRDITDLSLVEILFIGFAQAVAVVPGISRSGITIGAALLCGVKPVLAARFSFLLAFPAIFGAALYELPQFFSQWGEEMNLGPLILGGLAAFAAGAVAIKVLFRIISEEKIELFAYYCWTLGIITVIVYLFQ